ncbi:NTP transferase domain-containing protein [Siminovitchia sediminis]|uniref:NTP transferase domain-containing protein n=1 Tax=Siminovitchia sediminis TaxID=1274353 RepID=A0ABW4KBK8_9BACI
MKDENIGAIILAAGTASRMGTAKQLLNLGEKPMLARVIDLVLTENFSEVIAVIGHEANKIQETIPVPDVRFRWVINENYPMGQGTSLKQGMSQISKHHSSAMVFLGDLPFISRQTIHGIYELGKSMLKDHGEPFVVQPSYQGTAGHPVFFGKMNSKWFEEVQGDQGAKAIMSKFKVKKRLPMEDRGILFDIDTPEAYKRALKSFEKS